jgi:hypothetical protein
MPNTSETGMQPAMISSANSCPVISRTRPGRFTAYDDLYEGITVLAARAPKLESALLATKMALHSGGFMPQRSDGTIEIVQHPVRRITIQVNATFDEFRSRYETAVPVFQRERFAGLVEKQASWQDILDATADNAPHDFILYWSSDFTALMRLAGDRGRCVEYLMGNHTIAQRMYRYNPAILLYAPLRTAIFEDADKSTWFTLDQPSSRFGSFNTPQITKVGLELDHKVAALLEHLGTRVPEELAYS